MNQTKDVFRRIFIRFMPFLLLLTLLGACRAPEIQQDPDVIPISVFYTPALRPMISAFQACAGEQPQTVLFTQELPSDSIQDESSGIAFHLGEPAGELPYAAQITWETLAVIVNADNPVETLSAEQLDGIYSGEITNWEPIAQSTAAVQIWVYPQGNELTRIVDEALLAGQAVSTQALLAADPAGMISGVGSDPGAVGVIPSAWLEQQSPAKAQVKAVHLDRALAMSLRRPVLAVTPAEPQGPERDFLSCLQNGAGQTVLDKRYSP